MECLDGNTLCTEFSRVAYGLLRGEGQGNVNAQETYSVYTHSPAPASAHPLLSEDVRAGLYPMTRSLTAGA